MCVMKQSSASWKIYSLKYMLEKFKVNELNAWLQEWGKEQQMTLKKFEGKRQHKTHNQWHKRKDNTRISALFDKPTEVDKYPSRLMKKEQK